MWHFAADTMSTMRDWWICVIDKLRWVNDGATYSSPAGYGAAHRRKKNVSKMKKKYYLKLKDMLIVQAFE